MSEADHDAVLARDGWHCRYCGIGVIDRRARKQLVALLGDPPVWGRFDSQRHAALLVLSGVADHVEAAASFSDPALADSHENLVASYYTCNFGKSSFTCDQLGLQDPRQNLELTHSPVHIFLSDGSRFEVGDEDFGNSSDPLTEIPQLSAEVVCC